MTASSSDHIWEDVFQGKRDCELTIRSARVHNTGREKIVALQYSTRVCKVMVQRSYSMGDK